VGIHVCFWSMFSAFSKGPESRGGRAGGDVQDEIRLCCIVKAAVLLDSNRMGRQRGREAKSCRKTALRIFTRLHPANLKFDGVKIITYFTSERRTQASGAPEIAPKSSILIMQYLNNYLMDRFKTQYLDIPMPYKLSMETVKQLQLF